MHWDKGSKPDEPAARAGAFGSDAASSVRDVREAPHALLGAVVAGCPTGLGALDDAGRLILVNDALCAALGRGADALRSAPFAELLDAEGSRRACRAMARVRTGVAQRFEAVPAAARERPLRIELTPVGLAGVLAAVGISDAPAADERIGAAGDRKRLLQFALDAARMGTWSWDPTRDVATHDRRAQQILDGVSEESSFASALRNHLVPDAAERYAQGLKEILDPASERHQFERELRWRRRDGEWRWIQMTGEAHFEGEGPNAHVTLVTGTVLDITERKRTEQALAEASVQKDRFLATLAHELRNPLAPLYYAVELLRGDSREELDWARGVIERQVSHLTRLVDDLLDISRIARGHLEVRREPVAIAEVVRAAVEASRGALEEHEQQLSVQVPDEPIVVRGDFVRLTQVLTNLLKNAAKFSTGPGTVSLCAKRGTRRFVSLTVRDRGIGIAREELPHVFEMFYQGEPVSGGAQRGLGVGLYLVRRLVELHGGSVEVASDGEGQGSAFTAHLPVEARSADAATHAERPHAPSRRGWRVLVIDDNRDSADALAKLLRAGGDEVQTAYEGWAALRLAERFRPDVVLLDLDMPTIDGYEVCRRLRAQPWGKQILMVALTGWGRAEDRTRTREAGFDEHLVKPVSAGDVETLLRGRAASH